MSRDSTLIPELTDRGNASLCWPQYLHRGPLVGALNLSGSGLTTVPIPSAGSAKMQLGLPSHKQWLSTLRAEHVKQRPCRPAGTRTRACDVSERGWHAHDACACSCHVVSTDGHEASLARRRRRLMRLVHVVPAHRSRQRRGGARHVGANFREAGLRCIGRVVPLLAQPHPKRASGSDVHTNIHTYI